jgi:hypothetical protein
MDESALLKIIKQYELVENLQCLTIAEILSIIEENIAVSKGKDLPASEAAHNVVMGLLFEAGSKLKKAFGIPKVAEFSEALAIFYTKVRIEDVEDYLRTYYSKK